MKHLYMEIKIKQTSIDDNHLNSKWILVILKPPQINTKSVKSDDTLHIQSITHIPIKLSKLMSK